jgi:hypothetical protein
MEYTLLARDAVDADELNQYDVVILFGLNQKLGYISIPETRALVIANAYDSSYIDAQYIANAKACGCTRFFYHHCPQWFYTFAPADWKYCQVQMIIEPGNYQNAVPWNIRNKSRVLLTGTTGQKQYYFLRRYLQAEAPDAVKYVPIHEYTSRDKYIHLLNNFRANISACSVTTVNKYAESLAAGCLTFACCTDVNGWQNLGLIDGVNCISINQENCISRIREYLADVDNPKYEAIAAEGRRHALENLNNDVMVDKLIDWIEGGETVICPN